MGGKITKNFSRILFTNTLFKGLSPLLDCQNVIYRGHTGGGRGYIPNMGGVPGNEGGNISY
jgi:hypothetical protein